MMRNVIKAIFLFPCFLVLVVWMLVFNSEFIVWIVKYVVLMSWIEKYKFEF